MNFVRFGNTAINLDRVTYIEEGVLTHGTGSPDTPFIRFNFGQEEALGFFQTSWNGKETPEYPIVKEWLDQLTDEDAVSSTDAKLDAIGNILLKISGTLRDLYMDKP